MRTSTKRIAIVLTLAAAAALAACATARQYLALRQVSFHIDRADGIRLAGVSLDRLNSFSDLNPLDAARLGAAVLHRRVPLVFDLHVIGENPAQNHVTARLVRMQWTLALNGQETVSGTIDTVYTFAPGAPTDMAVPISLDLYEFFRTSARDAFDLALGLSGIASRPTEISLRALPTVDTPLGAIRYPEPITIARKTVGGP